ncbi:IPTL-CTERM sorting domain-containing protein [Ottowia sp.]|uniref:IPTL-CTERM sorting domain-containing protein n=1 Tax=Ottowia sp. TaxID=1898956 RepID=UPI0039E60E3D
MTTPSLRPSPARLLAVLVLATVAVAGALRLAWAAAVPAAPAPASAQLPAADWQQIQGLMQAHAYRFQPRPDGSVAAASPAQQWQARFERGGQVSLRGTAGGQPWQLGLQLTGIGYGSRLQAPGVAPAPSVEGDQVHYLWSEQLTEEWSNDARGLEQWFRLARRPAGHDADKGGAPLTLRLALGGDYRARQQRDAVVLHAARAGLPDLRYHQLRAWDANGRSVPGRLHAQGDALVLTLDDRAAQYPLTIDPLVQQAYLKASNAEAADEFGYAVAVSGNTVVVGAHNERSAANAVNGDQADNGADQAGAAYIFVRGGGVWSQQAYLKASNAAAFDKFGQSVAISGDTVVVGANAKASDGFSGSGAAYVFVRSGTAWSQQAYLKASNVGKDDNFGWSVAVSGDTLVVGADNEASSATGVNGNQADNGAANAGAAYVFVRSGTTWSQQAYLKASNTEANDYFGISVAISGDTVVIGANNEDSSATGVNGDQADNSAANAGAAYVFVRSGGVWSQQAYLKASNTGAADWFGHSVAISGDTVVVGANSEASTSTGVNGNQADDSAAASGAAYVFVRSGGNWSQQAYLKASNTGVGDWFGWSVAISGDTLVVGAPLESSDAAGVDGDQTSDGARASGAAYVFTRSGGTWSQQAYLKASSLGVGDEFGYAVAVAGNTLVAGALGEDSNATGVGGDQADNNASSAGAAYVFAVPDVTTTYTITPSAGPNGTLDPSTPQTVAAGATQSFEVVPDAGYVLDAIGGCAGTLNGVTYTTAAASADCTVSASFRRVQAVTHTITPVASPAAGGGVSCDPNPVDDGSTATCTAIPANGWHLTGIGGCNGSPGTTSPYTTGQVTADCRVTATFAQDTTTTPVATPPTPVSVLGEWALALLGLLMAALGLRMLRKR